MREIITLHGGQCGVRIGYDFWKQIASDHNLNEVGIRNVSHTDTSVQHLEVYFQEQQRVFVPRAVMFDLEPGVIDSIRGQTHGGLFRSDLMVSGRGSAGNNWAKGYYTGSMSQIDRIMDSVRWLIEECDSLQGFQFSHALGGGTGSGMGSLLLERLKSYYPDKINQTFTLTPSPKISECVVEPYNAVLSMHQLVQNADQCMMLDNEGLLKVCTKQLGMEKVTYQNMNSLICAAMSDITSSLRYSGLLNSDLRKMSVSLTPFPRVHFFSLSHTSFGQKKHQQYDTLSIHHLFHQLLTKTNFMSSNDIYHGRIMTGSIALQGEFNTSEIEEGLLNLMNKNSSYFYEWIPNNLQYSLCRPVKKVKTATLVANCSSIQDTFKMLSEKFVSLFRRKAFLHWFTSEGMDEMEFTEAESAMNDLTCQYQGGDSGCCEDDEGDYFEQ